MTQQMPSPMSRVRRGGTRLALAGLLAAGLGAGLASPAAALTMCAAPPLAESRSIAFDARIFEPGGSALSVAGRGELVGFARQLDPQALEVVIVSVPVGAIGDDAQAAGLAAERAEVVRAQLARGGVARERIYVEQRRLAVPARLAAQAPVVVETVGAAPRHAAFARGWRCMA